MLCDHCTSIAASICLISFTLRRLWTVDQPQDAQSLRMQEPGLSVWRYSLFWYVRLGALCTTAVSSFYWFVSFSLSEGFGQLTNLEKLDLCFCSSLVSLPEGILYSKALDPLSIVPQVYHHFPDLSNFHSPKALVNWPTSRSSTSGNATAWPLCLKVFPILIV